MVMIYLKKRIKVVYTFRTGCQLLPLPVPLVLQRCSYG